MLKLIKNGRWGACEIGYGMGERTSVDTDAGIVFDVQVNVFLNTESKISSITKIASFQLVFLDLETAFKDFLSLATSSIPPPK